MNQVPKQPKPVSMSDIVNLCFQTVVTIQTIIKKDPKLITQQEFSNVTEGLRMMSSFIPDIYHIIKNIEEQQKIKIVQGNGLV